MAATGAKAEHSASATNKTTPGAAPAATTEKIVSTKNIPAKKALGSSKPPQPKPKSSSAQGSGKNAKANNSTKQAKSATHGLDQEELTMQFQQDIEISPES